jgi:hypothetical protein
MIQHKAKKWFQNDTVDDGVRVIVNVESKTDDHMSKGVNRSERKLEIECCNIARKLGLAAVKLEKNGNTGIPDYLFIKKGGRSLYVEFKRPGGGGVVSAEQRFWADFLGDSHVFVDSVGGFANAIGEFFDLWDSR